MKFIKAVTLEGNTEYFNADHVLSITPNGNSIKILMGAGLYWNVKPGTLEIVSLQLVVNTCN